MLKSKGMMDEQGFFKQFEGGIKNVIFLGFDLS